MNLISGTHYSCEMREHAFMVLREYTIISLSQEVIHKAIVYTLISPTHPSGTNFPIRNCKKNLKIKIQRLKITILPKFVGEAVVQYHV